MADVTHLAVLLCMLLRSVFCAVNLTHNTLVCGKTAILTCNISPFDGITWLRNSNIFSSCYIDETCDFPSFDDYTFAINRSLSQSIITINPLTYSNYSDNTFSCQDSSSTSTVTLNISVPLDSVALNEGGTGNIKQVTATSNCLKYDVDFIWTCVSDDNESIVIADNCDISSQSESTDSTDCTTGGSCTGTGIARRINILSFTEFNGTGAQNVKLRVEASYGGVTVNAISTNSYKIQVSPVTTQPPSNECPSWCLVLIIVLILSLVGIIVEILIWKEKIFTAVSKRSDKEENIQESKACGACEVTLIVIAVIDVCSLIGAIVIYFVYEEKTGCSVSKEKTSCLAIFILALICSIVGFVLALWILCQKRKTLCKGRSDNTLEPSRREKDEIKRQQDAAKENPVFNKTPVGRGNALDPIKTKPTDTQKGAKGIAHQNNDNSQDNDKSSTGFTPRPLPIPGKEQSLEYKPSENSDSSLTEQSNLLNERIVSTNMVERHDRQGKNKGNGSETTETEKM